MEALKCPSKTAVIQYMVELKSEHLMERGLKLWSPLQTWTVNNQMARASLPFWTTLFGHLPYPGTSAVWPGQSSVPPNQISSSYQKDEGHFTEEGGDFPHILLYMFCGRYLCFFSSVWNLQEQKLLIKTLMGSILKSKCSPNKDLSNAHIPGLRIPEEVHDTPKNTIVWGSQTSNVCKGQAGNKW